MVRLLTLPHIKVIRKLFAEPMDCYKRGDFEVQLQIDGIGGIKELAIAASIQELSSASHSVVLFTSDDCEPDNAIDSA